MYQNAHRRGDMSPISLHRVAEWLILLVKLPGLPPKPAGVLLVDLESDKLHITLANKVSKDRHLAKIWSFLRDELEERATEMGAIRLLDSLEADLSHFLQVEGTRHRISTADPNETLMELFQNHVLHNSALSRGT